MTQEELNKVAKEASSIAYPYEENGIIYDRDIVNDARDYYEEGFISGVKWVIEHGITEK